MNDQAFYNEIDKDAAAWLRELIAEGHIAPGIVDERSIEDVRPDELAGFTQCHFFAGIGIWSLALRAAGIPDDYPIWSGSCPCQPFSSAGKGDGFFDERHLWPAFHHLISQRRPPAVVGEQVASKNAMPWIDLVFDDLEAAGYACAAIAFPSSSVGAPHIRDRLYWVADSAGDRRVGKRAGATVQAEREPGPAEPGVLALGLKGRAVSDACAGAGMDSGGLADTESDGHEWAWKQRQQAGRDGSAHNNPISGVAYAGSSGLSQQPGRRDESQGLAATNGTCLPGPTNGFWRDADWLGCRDGKWRPVEPGTQPLAYGLPRSMGNLSPELRRLAAMAGLSKASLKRAKQFRVGSLRGYGNAINAIAAQAFIESLMGTI